MLGSSSLVAQDNLFKPTSVGKLNETQQSRYNKIINAPYALNPQMIQVQNLVESQVLGNVKITLPNVNCENLVFKPKTVEYTSENHYYWYGVIESDDNLPCETGTLTLMARNGEKFGTIKLDDAYFEYKDISGGKQVLIKHNKEFFTAGCGNKPIPETPNTPWIPPPYPSAPIGCNGASSDTPGQIDVLVLYTPNAAAKEPNMYNKASLAVQGTNQAFLNSSLNSYNTRLNLVMVMPFAFVESGNAYSDIQIRIPNNIIAQNLRNTYKADLVVVFTGVDYGNIAGIVPEIGPINNLAYAIVDVDYVNSSSYTFAHEIAHLFGARHHNDPNGIIEHGYRFQTGLFSLRTQCTIMGAYANDSPIQNFSNPYIKYKGEDTGTTGSNNNAQKIFSTSYALGNFRNSLAGLTAPFVVEIIKPVEVYLCHTSTSQVQAKLTCGVAPFTYEWRTSLNGIRVFIN